MDERVELFLQQTGPVLCLDIGYLTQKAILARPGWPCESWPRFLLPSPARLVTQRIREMTLLKSGIWLYGSNMGGSFNEALRAHIAVKLPAYSTEAAAKSIHDNLGLVRQVGINISDTCPIHCAPIYLTDYDSEFWLALLRHSSLPLPHMTIAAVQDHGNNDNGNREARMMHWRKLLRENPDPVNWVYEKAPENMDRLKSLQAHTGGPVADTATASILGALCDETFIDRGYRQGVTLICAGNCHILAALVYQAKVYGIYEHHTEKTGIKALFDDLASFRKKWLPSEKVQKEGGQGTAFGQDMSAADDWQPTFLLGPKRGMLRDFGQFIAPHGDMPHAGCFGLLYGWSRAHARV